MDRGDFFKKGLTLAIGETLRLFEDNKLLRALEGEAEPWERPPGADPLDDRFQELCTGCDACMIACPVDVIMIADQESRLPLIYPEKDPCVRCPDTPCITSCPTGALSLPE